MKFLRLAGLVKGFRGPGGGYRLTKPADEIPVLDIILATETTAPAWRNIGIPAFSETSPPREVFEMLDRVQHHMLGHLSLADIVNGSFNNHPLVREVFSVLKPKLQSQKAYPDHPSGGPIRPVRR
jgi:Rrf2 family iron-sulfur cluster assembly transcriptional regulator